MDLPYGFLYEQETKNSLDRIFNAKFHGDLLLNIHALQRSCNKNFSELQKLFRDLVKKHAELKEDGEPVEPQGPGTFKIKEDHLKEWNSEIAALMAKEFSLGKFKKVNINRLLSTGLQLSSIDIQNLEPILEGLDPVL